MGLLTKPGTSVGEKNQLVVLLERFGLKVAILMYFVGVAWLLVLANAEYNLGTYFSENALLPGLVVENYAENQMPAFLKTLTEKEKADTISPTDFGDLLKQVGIHEVQYQNFTIIHPINGQGQGSEAGATIFGTNTYGILRAKRAAGTEALVFSTPYFSRSGTGRKNLVGIAMMLALAEYFQRQVYWAKDIIFLIPDGHIGSLAWVKGHQEIHDSNPYFLIERVKAKSGNIQAAINVVMESNTICTLETKFHGLNGKLPNLDLVNLMNKFVVREREKYPNWEADIWKLVSYIQMQATGTPTGSHGFFLKYGIESITLVGKGSPKSCKRPQAFGDISRVLEATFRSLNNLLERFHQSFFFYLKTTPNRFISIGLYYPPIALILLLIPVKGAILWLTSKDMETTRGLVAVAGFHAMALGARWLLANFKKCFLFPAELQFTPELFTLLVVSLASVQVFIITTYIQHQQSQSPSTSANLIDSIYCFVLLELATCLYSLALFNPSAVIVIGVIAVPLIILVRPGKFPALTSWLVVLATLTVGVSFYYPNLHHVINKYYYESEIYGNFLFDLCFLMFVPIVSTFIAIL